MLNLGTLKRRYWDVVYDAFQLEPDDADLLPVWDRLSAGTFTAQVESDSDCLNGKRLTIHTPETGSGDKLSYLTPDPGSIWEDNVRARNGWHIQARLKVIDSASNTGQVIHVRDGTNRFPLNIKSDRISISSLFLDGPTIEYLVDLTDGYHVLDIHMPDRDNIVTVSVDGIERISGEIDRSTSDKYIEFGDYGTALNFGGEVHWDYIKYFASLIAQHS